MSSGAGAGSRKKIPGAAPKQIGSETLITTMHYVLVFYQF